MQNYSEQYQQALTYHRSGRLSEAKEIYVKILEANHNNDAILHLLGILAAQQKDFATAFTYLEQALAINPNSAALCNSMGNVCKNIQKFTEAIAYYHNALKIQPNYAVAHNNLGNVYYALNQLENAATAYHAAIALQPDYIDANYNLSLILTAQGKPQAAIAILTNILAIDQYHAEAHSHLAKLLQQLGDYATAIKHYQQSLHITAENAIAHNNLGVILLNHRNRQNQAIRHFKYAIYYDPTCKEAYYNLGSVFLMQNQLEIALKYFLHLSQLQSDFDVRYNIGVTYMDMGRSKDAIDYFQAALQLQPNDIATHTNLGAIYLKQENIADAINHYSAILQLQPNNVEIQYIVSALQQKQSPHKISAAPNAYVEHLFDQYAKVFDQHLQLLQYKAPEIIADALEENLHDTPNNSLSILDLGCGTGLCGEKLSHLAKTITGIDLSKNMLEIARQKNIYTDLVLGNLQDLIVRYTNIDLIVAADTLVYFGDLSKVISDCYHTLSPNGMLIFTIEKTDNYPYILQRTARFAHTQAYIDELAEQCGFASCVCKDVVVRNQRNIPVASNLYILKK